MNCKLTGLKCRLTTKALSMENEFLQAMIQVSKSIKGILDVQKRVIYFLHTSADAQPDFVSDWEDCSDASDSPTAPPARQSCSIRSPTDFTRGRPGQPRLSSIRRTEPASRKRTRVPCDLGRCHRRTKYLDLPRHIRQCHPEVCHDT